MNRTTLLVAIAAIAVVGIALGLFLAGQNGQLTGALGSIPTSINLSVSGCSPPDSRGYVSYTIAGYLVDSSGRPVADRTISLIGVFYPETGPGLSAVEQFVTGADGSFRVRRDVRPSVNSTGDNYQASFGGDTQYGASTSEKVYTPC